MYCLLKRCGKQFVMFIISLKTKVLYIENFSLQACPAQFMVCMHKAHKHNHSIEDRSVPSTQIQIPLASS
jgi:hypothetical protein